MNNAIFSNTMENMCDRIHVKLLTKWESKYSAEAMIAKPNFHSCSVFSENLVAIELRKLEVKFDKSIRVHPYPRHVCTNFTTSTWHRCFAKKCKIMYINTNNLIYHVEYDDVYDIMKTRYK